MSKSAGNTIVLSDSPPVIQQKLRGAVTDPLKVRKNDPGRPEVCLVFTYQQKFNAGEAPEIAAGCRAGSLGCVECKNRIAARIADTLTPFRDARAHLEAHPGQVEAMLREGEDRARGRAAETMADVRRAMRLG